MTTLQRPAKDVQSAVGQSVPYVALGDSLTQGAQSLGVAAISQRCSYPALIAEFLGIESFTQPLLQGDIQTYRAGHVGNPPNVELVLRQAEQGLTKEVLVALSTQRSITFSEQLKSAWAALRQEVHDFIGAVETHDPDEFLVKQPDARRPYQNLGVISFTTRNVMEEIYHGGGDSATWWDLNHLGHLIRGATERIASTWSEELRAHTNPLAALLGEPGALLGDLASAITSQIGNRIDSEKTGYVLGREGKTALELARVQQPHLVTLFIGNTEGPIRAALQGNMTTGKGEDNWEHVDSFRTDLKKLIDAILAFESHPYVFVATLPSPTATPSLVRDRLGHWKPLFPPTAAYLTDSDLQHLELVSRQYNDVIQDLAHKNTGPYKRLFVVDVHSLHERMLRGTRRDAEAARRAVAHGMRVGGIDDREAQALLKAVRAGRHDILDALGYRGRGRLLHTSATTDSRISNRARTLERSYIKEIADQALSSPKSGDESLKVDDFRVLLKMNRVYRLTGEYLATDAEHAGAVVQGGMVGLDGLHLTNTGYAYVARLFLQEIRKAHTKLGDVLDWILPDGTRRILPGAQKNDTALDEMVLRVAREDSLLNALPVLLPAVMDLADAIGEILGSAHGPALPAQRE